MQGFDFFCEEVVRGFLAEEEQKLAEGVRDQALLRGSGRFGRRDLFRFRGGEVEGAEGGLDDAGGDAPASGHLDRTFPGQLRLVGLESNQGTDLGFVIGW